MTDLRTDQVYARGVMKKSQYLRVRIPATVKAEIEALAAGDGTTVSRWVRRALASEVLRQSAATNSSNLTAYTVWAVHTSPTESTGPPTPPPAPSPIGPDSP